MNTAAEVFLSSPAVSNRIEKMEKAGIITGYHAQINYRLFDYHIKAFINLEVEPYQKKEFYPFIQAIPNVIECICVTGDYAMLIEVAPGCTDSIILLYKFCQLPLYFIQGAYDYICRCCNLFCRCCQILCSPIDF